MSAAIPCSDSNSTSSPRSTSSNPISLCLSTAYTNSTSHSFPDNNQPHLSGIPPNLAPKPVLPLKPDKSIYSFAWTSSYLEVSDRSQSPCISFESSDKMSRPIGGNQTAITELNALNPSRARYLAPTLPSPTFWTSVTLPKIFQEYINANKLLPGNCNVVADSTHRAHPSEALSKHYNHQAAILKANTDLTKVNKKCPTNWIEDHFSNDKLPVPFQPSLLEKSPIWKISRFSNSMSTFRKLPDTSSDEKTARWFNRLADALGALHDLDDIDPGTQTGDRTFTSEGSSLPLAGGLHERKPDITVIDRDYRDKVPAGVRLKWSLAQAFIEVTSQDSRSYNEIMRNILSKAANILHSQIHRKYVIALSISGSRENNSLTFFCVFVDRIGASTTLPLAIRGYSAMSLARIVFMLAFGNDTVLGYDTAVTIDRLTGNAISVMVDGRKFTFVTEIFNSPFLFGRGTRVFIVKDEDGRHHILKDSWILITHDVSEVENLKIISKAAQGADAQVAAVCMHEAG